MILSNENKMILQKIKTLFVAHRLFQINVFRVLYSFEFCHCVHTTDHVGWIIPSRVMPKFCQNCLYILMKLTRFGLCLFIQSLFIKVQSINDSYDTGYASRNNNFSSEIIYLHFWSASSNFLQSITSCYENRNTKVKLIFCWVKDLDIHNITTIQLSESTS